MNKLAALLPLALLGCVVDDAPFDVGRRLERLGGAPCAGAPDFSCVQIPVPRDHAAPDGPTRGIAVAVRPASGEEPSLGLLVTLYGGPGYSGLAAVDDLSGVDPRLRERFDLVYFDQRGVGASGGVDCREASAAWYGPGLRATPGQAELDLAARAATFASACAAETGLSPTELRLLDTAQAAEDLHTIKVALAAPEMTLYGLSYGTQLAQEYATRHPEGVRAIVLDGAIDLTRRDIEYSVDVARAVNDVLKRTFDACSADAACAADLGNARAAYDAVANTLAKAPPFDAPLPNGERRARGFSRADLDSLTAAAMDDQTERARFLRGLAAASKRQSLVPWRRQLDDLVGYDPATDAWVGDPLSDAAYYAFTCNDYGRIHGGLDQWLGEIFALDPKSRSYSPFFGDLPCVTWPSASEEIPRPSAFAPPGVTTLVLSADSDVATPFDEGLEIVDNLRIAGSPTRSVTVSGGHHVMFGGESACVNDAVSSFLLAPNDTNAPLDAKCEAGLVAPYVALGPADAIAITTGIGLGLTLETELFQLPELPGEGAWGCDRAGFVEMTADLAVALHGCSFVDGLVLDGGGAYDAATDTLALHLDASGAKSGAVDYARTGEHHSAKGTLDGQPIDERD